MNGNGENKELNSNDFETDNSGTADIKEQDEEATFGWGWRIICILFALTAVVYLFALIIPSFADFMSEKVGAVIRYALAIPTNILPFSLAEIILILLPFALVALVVFACIKHCGTWKRVFAFSGKILCVGMVIMMLYMCGFGPGYHGTTIDKKLGLDKQPVSEDELYDLVFVLSSNINTLAEKVEYDEATDFSVMPYSYGEMNAKLLSAYETVSETYPFIPVMRSRVKPVMLSKLMSYTHMTGVYSFFTGEANFNTDFPDYTTPFTAAHELAHQRGVAREDEASFVAYLVCMASDDDYIKYSGYREMFEYTMNAYIRAVDNNFYCFFDTVAEHGDVKAAFDSYEKNNSQIMKLSELFSAVSGNEELKEAVRSVDAVKNAYNKCVDSANRYNGIWYNLNDNVVSEIEAYSAFFEQYDGNGNIAAKVSDKVNDTYLKLHGTEGSVSYGMVVDLAVAYNKKING